MALTLSLSFSHRLAMMLSEQNSLKVEKILDYFGRSTILFGHFCLCKRYLNDKGKPQEKEHDLHSTDDGESSEESHGASNETQLGLRLDLSVSLDVVKGGRGKVDIH